MKFSELTDRIYDTLTGCAGFSKFHKGLDVSDISDCEVDATKGRISLVVDGTEYEIKITESPAILYLTCNEK